MEREIYFYYGTGGTISCRLWNGIPGDGVGGYRLWKTEDEKGQVRYDMCKAIEDMKRDERQEGRREGRQSGELAMAIKTVKNLMKNQKITFEEAVTFLEIPKRMQGKMRSMI